MAFNKIFSFHRQLKAGNKGEMEFCEKYSHLNPQKSVDNRAFDFHSSIGTIELKTDYYKKTENFFLEFYSDEAKQKIGGPWRAARDKVDHFVYYFPVDGTFFWFETKKLVAKLNNLIKKGEFPVKKVRNIGWIATGYAIPRTELKSIYREEK